MMRASPEDEEEAPVMHPNFLPLEALHRIWCYYRERLPALDTWRYHSGRWHATCPTCCHQTLEIDGSTGAWRCEACCHDGDLYAFEMRLTGCTLDEAVLQVEEAYLAQLGLMHEALPAIA